MKRALRIYWYRDINQWTVATSGGTMHFERLVIRAPMEAVLQNRYPRAYLKGRGEVISHGDWAEVV